MSATGATLPAEAQIRLLRAGLSDIGGLIERTRTEIAGLALDRDPGIRLANASDELDAVVSATETAAEEIMSAAERMQDRLRRLRDEAAAADAIVAMEADATAIVVACSFQDLTGQRIRKVVQALTYIEARVRSLNALWQGYIEEASPDPLDSRPDAALMHGPSADGLGQGGVDAVFAAASQSEIDRLFG